MKNWIRGPEERKTGLLGKIATIFVIGLMLMLGLFFNGSVCGEIEGEGISLNANYTGITFEEATVTPAEEYWAVIVGATSVYAYQDAHDIYNVLTRASDNWEASHIRFLVNESATKANIRNAIQWMANNAGTEDTCLFFFSGHGDNDTLDHNGDEADGIDESLRVFDAEIIDDELEEWIGEVKAKKAVAILSACYSGGVLTPYQISEATETYNTYELDGFAMDLEKANCMVLASSRMNETGIWASALKNGVFTYYIVQGLWGAADLDGDSRISIRELSDYSFPKIVEYSENFYPNPQHPLLWPEDDTASNLTLIKLKTHVPKKICVPEEYLTIQEAVEAAMPGDTIEVYPGTYNENLVINKPLTIYAPNGDSIIQAANTAQSCIFITVDNTSISGLTVQNGLYGIYLYKSNNSWITNNVVMQNNESGILLWSSNNNTLIDNLASDNKYGIWLYKSINNNITNNTAGDNENDGIYFSYSNNNSISSNNCSNTSGGGSILLWSSNNNSIENNTANNNKFDGIRLRETSNHNTIKGNVVNANNESGILLWASNNNTLIENLASDNKHGIWLHESSNNNNVTNNTAGDNENYGIYFSYSNNNSISSNNCSNISGGGSILLWSSNNNSIENNTANNNKFDGIRLRESSNRNAITGNVVNSNNESGILLWSSNNNSIENNTAKNNRVDGIYLLKKSNNNRINDNDASNNDYHGISLNLSTSNEICNNIANSNHYQGIRLLSSSGSTIANNTAENNSGNGIYLSYSSTNKLTGNIMLGNGIVIRGYLPTHYEHEIDKSNTVNGKPVYYWRGIEGGIIPDGAGQVILINCKNILVENQNLNNASIGIQTAYSSYITIKNNNCSHNSDGIYLSDSNNNSISSNDCSNNRNGIYLFLDSNNNSISNNNCSSNNHYGISIWYSNSNKIYLNNFINNTENVYSYKSTNIWNSPEKINYTYMGSTYTNYLGNYWHNFTSTDANNDGIWDNPYIIDPDKDYYPLMES
ncbi:MAG: NosD domain-containing protein [Halobacteriota archaeon]